MMKNVMNLEMFGGWDEVLREGNATQNKTEFTKLQNGVTELRFLDDNSTLAWVSGADLILLMKSE